MSYFHIGFYFSKPLKAEKQGRINEQLRTVCPDWFYYASNCYIVYSENTPDRIHIAIREALEDGDQFLIMPLDMRGARQGLLPEWMWSWLNLDRAQPNWWETRGERVMALMPPPAPPSPSVSSADIYEVLKALMSPKNE